ARAGRAQFAGGATAGQGMRGQPGGGPAGGVPAIYAPAAPPVPAPLAPKSEAAEAKPPGEEARREMKESLARDGRSGGKKDAANRAFDAPADRLAAAGDAESQFFEDDRTKLGLVRQLYRKLDPTVEWAENNYYKLRITEQTAALVGVGPFWMDYARHDGKGPFLSRHLADASRTFTEMMFALAVLDLPFESPKHVVKFDGGRMTLTPAGPVVAFHEEVRPAAAPDGTTPVLVG